VKRTRGQARADALAELERRRADLVGLCADLIRIPTENPPGDTTKLVAFIAGYLRERGIRSTVHEPRTGMPNLVATVGRGRPNLVLSAHLDEFPAGGGWTVPPFAGLVEKGRIIGRGAGDMRAGLAVAMLAAALVKASGVSPRGQLTLAFASDEETGGTWGTQWLLGHVRAVRGDACLIGESSGTWSAGVGEKGVLWLRITAAGVSGHAAYAQGESAVAKVLAVVQAAQALAGTRGRASREVAALVRAQRAAAERQWGPGTGALADRVGVNVGTLRGGGQVNLIPAAAEAEIDFRLPPGLRTAAVIAAIERAARRAGGVRVEVVNRCESYVTSPRERLVRLVVDSAAGLGLRVLPVLRLGYTDGRFFRRAGIPTVVYGPRVHGMGGPDEFIEEDELMQVARVHVATVFDYLGIA
jgi:succinyl-diaminopimelate desuccinylase